jgi:L-lactate dehydrogenase complex protein LldG
VIVTSRERILSRLRSNRAPFQNAPPPDNALSVTHVEPGDVLTRFQAELERLTGQVFMCDSPQAALLKVVELIGDERRVLAWDDLPVPELRDTLVARGVTLEQPRVRGAERDAALRDIEPIRIGLTGADAGLATTGTLVLSTSEQHGRLASLLPPVHIAILRKEDVFPTLEAWIAARGRDSFASSNSVAFITGPSRTGDIEMQLVIGVHGPGTVQVVVY